MTIHHITGTVQATDLLSGDPAEMKIDVKATLRRYCEQLTKALHAVYPEAEISFRPAYKGETSTFSIDFGDDYDKDEDDQRYGIELFINDFYQAGEFYVMQNDIGRPLIDVLAEEELRG
jgi:hypothetical protein